MSVLKTCKEGGSGDRMVYGLCLPNNMFKIPAMQIITQMKIVQPSPAVFGNAKKIMM